jgi:hypothetical protein
MTDNKKLWYSQLEFRYNPADPSQGSLDLGLALEFMTSQYWVVGLAMRAALDQTRLATLDELTRKLLENRMAVMTRELEHVLPKAQRLGDVLKAFATSNPWSLYVSAPRSLALNASEKKASDKASTEKLAEDYVYKILEVTREKALKDADTTEEPGLVEIPPMWMLPAKTLMRPLR